MKLSINTKEKLIRLEESVNLGELFTQLEELLPDMKWREYTLLVKDEGPKCNQRKEYPMPFFTYNIT